MPPRNSTRAPHSTAANIARGLGTNPTRISPETSRHVSSRNENVHKSLSVFASFPTPPCATIIESCVFDFEQPSTFATTSTSASTRTTAQACAKRGFGRDREPTPLAASRHVSEATSNAQTSSNRVSPSSPPHPPKTHTVPRFAEAVGGWNAADAPSRARGRANRDSPR